MSILIVKEKGKTTNEIYNSLDSLKKRCVELKGLIRTGKAEVLGVSFDDEDEKTIIVKNGIIDTHKESEK